MKPITLLTFLVVSYAFGYCQTPDLIKDTISIKSGSFEISSFEESAWIVLGDKRFSPPDIHTPNEVIQNVKREAQDGSNFLSMVVRSNDSFEQIGQFLESSLEAGQKYALTFHAAQSPNFLAMSSNKELDDHHRSIHLKVYGLNILTPEDLEDPYILEKNASEVLFKSELINSEKWKEEKVVIKPKNTVNFIAFSVFWETPILLPYNGHLLLDNISDLIRIKE